MADINNSIGLDASQAIGEAGRLNRSLDTLNKELTLLKVNADGTVEFGFERSAAGAAKLAAGTRDVGKATQEAAGKANDLRLSWETVARVVQTQLLIRGINSLSTAFGESADAAAEFEITIGRINAIADQTETNFGDLSERIKTLSITLGRDLGETSAAVFEALQNDLGTTDETFVLLQDQAAKLALVTGGTLGDAVNSLSAVIKVYGQDSGDAANASGILFGAINAGRLTLSELEGNLGTVIPLAGRLGVSFEQAAAAIATISLAGVDAATAQTQLRNVLNKLIKPTDELKKAFRGLQVEGFQELIKSLDGDLTAALQAISGELGDNEQNIAKAFNTIRGNLGVFNILAQDGTLAAETLATVKDSALGLDEAFENISALDAQISNKNAAQLGVIFTEVGENALKLRNEATSAFLAIIDDSESANLALGTVAVGAGLATAAVIALKVAGVSAGSALLLGFSGPLGLAVATFAAFTLGVVGGVAALNKLEEASSGLGASATFQVNSLKQVVVTIKELNAQRLSNLIAELNNSRNSMNTLLRESQSTAQGIISAFSEVAEKLNQSGKLALDGFAEGRERVLDQIRSSLDGLDKDILSNTRDLAAAQGTLADFDFKQSIQGLSKSEQASRALQRSYIETAKAAELALSAGVGDGSRQGAEDQIKTAAAAAQFALQTAKAGGNVRDIASAQSQVRAGLQAQTALLKSQLRLQQEIPRQAMREQLDGIQNINESQKDAIEEQLGLQAGLAKQVADGVPLKDLQGQFDAVRKSLESIADSLPEFSDADIVRKFGLTNLAQSVEEQLLDSLNNLDVQWNTSIQGLKDQLLGEQFEATIKLNADIDSTASSPELQTALAGVRTDDPTKGLEQRLAIIKEFAIAQETATGKASLSSAVIKANVTEATKLLEAASGTGFFTNQAANAKAVAAPSIEAIKTIGTASSAELAVMQTKTGEAIAFVAKQTTGIGGALLEGTKKDLIAGLTAAFTAIQERQKQLSENPILGEQQRAEIDKLRALGGDPVKVPLDVDTSGIREADRQLDATEVSAREAAVSTAAIGTSANNATTSTGNLVSTTGTLVGAANNAEAAFRRMERAAREAASAAAAAATAGGNTGTAFHGGVQYRNSGGSSRGQDTIPMMLAPGEFVANQRATNNFLPELQAINAGNSPSSASSGNTNITIGDINVSSQSQLPSQTAREVGNSIKRELRRGTIKL